MGFVNRRDTVFFTGIAGKSYVILGKHIFQYCIRPVSGHVCSAFIFLPLFFLTFTLKLGYTKLVFSMYELLHAFVSHSRREDLHQGVLIYTVNTNKFREVPTQ
jgi:hypothetical protein